MSVLTSGQTEAVLRSHQDVCVVGGPGSGKTEVLLRRFLLRIEEGISPLRLLALAPTEEAAAGLRRELAPALADLAAEAAVCTVEGFSERLLRTFAVQVGLDPEFEVLNAAEAHQMLSASVDEALCSLAESERIAELWAALDFLNLTELLVGAHNSMRLTATAGTEGAALNDGGMDELFALADAVASAAADDQAAAEYREWAQRVLALKGQPASPGHFRVLNEFPADAAAFAPEHPMKRLVMRIRERALASARSSLATEYFTNGRALLWKALDAADAAYRRRKQNRNALDRIDLCEHAIRLFRDDTVLRTRVRSGFEEILLDDFQDLTPLQAGVLDLIRRPGRFFATGDDAQPRAAGSEAFFRFNRALRGSGAFVDRLSGSFRNSESMRCVAAAIVQNGSGASGSGNRARTGAEPDIEVIAVGGADADNRCAETVEAESVAARILALAGTPVRDSETGSERPAEFSDIAVFLHDQYPFDRFECALEQRGIPYCSGGPAFWRRLEIADLFHLLRAILNPRDEFSLTAVLRSPFAGISNDALYRLGDAGNLGCAVGRGEVESPALEPEDQDRLRRFRTLLQELRAHASDLSADRLLQRAVTESGYERTLCAQSRDNVERLLSWIRTNRHRTGSLKSLIRDLELQRSGAGDSGPPPGDRAGVALLPFSAAKGNERAIVFVAGLHYSPADAAPALAFSPSSGLVARWIDPDSGEPLHDPAYSSFVQEWGREQASEAERLRYVAMTRANSRLVLSFARRTAPDTWAARICSAIGLNFGDSPERLSVMEGGGIRARVWRPSAAPQPEFEQPAHTEAPQPKAETQNAGGQHDEIAGVTSIALFKSCPRRFFLGRQLGWQAARLTAVGSGSYVEDESIDSGDLGREVRRLLAGAGPKGASRQAVEMAARFEAGEIGKRAKTASRCERDFEFLMPAGGIVVQGRMDLWFEEAGELLLVGYKTDAIQPEEAWLRSDEYALEMRLYAMALRQHTGRFPNRVCLHFLRPDIVVPVSVDPDDIDAATESIREFSSAQNEAAFPLRESAQCFRCGFYRGMCSVRI